MELRGSGPESGACRWDWSPDLSDRHERETNADWNSDVPLRQVHSRATYLAGERRLVMTSYTASIERSNHKNLHQVELQVTPRETGRQQESWTGVFVSRSIDGFMPNERLA